jgi:hypothetical protein
MVLDYSDRRHQDRLTIPLDRPAYKLKLTLGKGGRCVRQPMSALGHVWTAPWQGLSDVSAALVGCGHVSGLLMRQVWPLALMLCADRVPIDRMHLKVR